MPYYTGTMRWIIRSGHATPREKILLSWLDNAENKCVEKMEVKYLEVVLLELFNG